MSYALYSEDGYLTDIASIGGWWDLITEVEKVRTNGPLAEFLNTGTTTNPKGVIEEIDQILPTTRDSNIRSILENMKTGLQKVKEIGIVSG